MVCVLVLGLALAACASGGSGSSGEAAADRPPRGVAPPAGHRLANVEPGMTPGQVTGILGAPTSEQSYQTGKAWIPFYWGSDLARTDWKYAGEGRVVFSQNRWSGALKVIRVDYDPGEDGR
jgi:hypothetical protein